MLLATPLKFLESHWPQSVKIWCWFTKCYLHVADLNINTFSVANWGVIITRKCWWWMLLKCIFRTVGI